MYGKVTVYQKIGILLWLAVVLSCTRKETSQQQSNNTHLISTWKNFRGDGQLRGRAREQLPDSLILAWSVETDGEGLGSPVIDEDNVYVGSGGGVLYAFRKTDGSLRWKFKTTGAIEAAPLVADDRVFIGDKDGTMYAVDRRTGAGLWTFTTDGSIVSSANMIAGNRPILLFGNHNDTLYAINCTDGSPVWKYASESYINGTPATDGTRIVFGGCDAHLHLLSARDGALIKKIDVGAYVAGSVALDGDHCWTGLYNGQLCCIDLDSMNILWTFRPCERPEPFFAPPAVTNAIVMAPSYDGFLYGVSRTKGTLVWKFAARDRINSAPVVCGDRCIVGSDDGWVYIVNVRNGTLVDSYEVGGAITSPAVGGGLVVVGDDNGRVSAFLGQTRR